MFTFILHPGDLAYSEMFPILVALIAMTMLPVFVIALIIYKVFVVPSQKDRSQTAEPKIGDQKSSDFTSV